MFKPLWTQPYPPRIIAKWLLLAFIAGNINAGGFLACKRFVTHLTGFGTWFGIAAADRDWRTAIGMLSVPAFFLVGSAFGAFFTDTKIARGGTPRFRLVLNLVALLLLAAAVGGYFERFGFFGAEFVIDRNYAPLVLLCSASGLLNVACTTSSGGHIRATHMTGTTTDLGIGLVRAFLGHKQGALRAREHYRNWLRIAQISGFAAGSVVGAVLFSTSQYVGFLLPCALALCVGDLAPPLADAGAGVQGTQDLLPPRTGNEPQKLA